MKASRYVLIAAALLLASTFSSASAQTYLDVEYVEDSSHSSQAATIVDALVYTNLSDGAYAIDYVVTIANEDQFNQTTTLSGGTTLYVSGGVGYFSVDDYNPSAAMGASGHVTVSLEYLQDSVFGYNGPYFTFID